MNENAFFKNLSSKTRITILACLGKSEKTVTEIIKNCDLSQSAVSQHLAYLRKSGLVAAQKKGLYQVYRIENKKLSKICEQLIEISKEII